MVYLRPLWFCLLLSDRKWCLEWKSLTKQPTCRLPWKQTQWGNSLSALRQTWLGLESTDSTSANVVETCREHLPATYKVWQTVFGLILLDRTRFHWIEHKSTLYKKNIKRFELNCLATICGPKQILLSSHISHQYL